MEEGRGVSDAELFDMLFGVPHARNNNNNLETATMASSTSPNYSSTVSDPGSFGFWEPGEIVDHDFEINSSSSTSSSSPIRPYANHFMHRRHSHLNLSHHGDLPKSHGKKRGPRPKQLTPEEKRQKRLDANDRERQRMGQLNVAFNHLRNVLPKHGNDRELSKFETIHLAKNYIRALNEMLCQAEATNAASPTNTQT